MATSRLLYRNLCTAQTFSAFNTAGSAVANAASSWSPPFAYAAGHVGFEARGTYTADLERTYVIHVKSSTDGTFAHTLWEWSDSGGATWNDTDLVPADGVWVSLNHGLEIRFLDTSVSPQFVTDDYLEARALRVHGIVKALDLSRDTEYWSGTLAPASTLRIGFDMGTPVQPIAGVLEDHNLPSTATVTWYAHATSLFTESGGSSHAATWRANRMVDLISSNAFRYWWVTITVGAAAIDPLKLSGLGLWLGYTFDQPPSIGLRIPRVFLGNLDATRLAHGTGPLIRTQARPNRTWQATKQDANSDGGRLDAALTYATENSSQQELPFYFIPLDSDLSTVEFNSWLGDLDRLHRFLDRWDYTVAWGEVLRRVAS